MKKRLEFKEMWQTSIAIIFVFIALSLLTQAVSKYVQLQSAFSPVRDTLVDTIVFTGGGVPLIYALVKRATNSIKEADSKFVTLVRQNITGIFIYQDGKYQYVNPRFAAMVGYTKEEFRNGQIAPADLIDKDHLDFAKEIIRQKFAGEDSPSTYELKYRKKSGDPVWVEVHTTVTTYQGKPAIIGTVIDRTESRKIETELRDSEERYRVLVEMSPDMIAYHQNGVFQYVNRAGIELLGAKSADEIVGRHVMDFVHPDYHPCVNKRLNQLLSGTEYAPTLERKFVRLDGRVIDVEGSGSRITIDGQPLIQIIIRDVTEHRREERLLRNKEQALSRAQAIAHVGSWETDLSDDSEWSDEMYEIFGLNKDAKVGFEAFTERIHPDDSHVVDKILHAARTGEGFFDMDFRIIRPNGQVRYVHSRSEIEADSQGRPKRMFGVVHDITERTKMEEELVHTKSQLQHIFDNVGVVLWSSGLSANQVTEVSSGIEHVYGITREEFMKDPLLWMTYLIPEDRERIISANKDVIRGQETTIDYRIIHPRTGATRWIQTQIFPEKNAADEVVAVNGITIDITDKKLIELELETKEEQYRSLFEHHPDAVYSLNPAGNFVELNPACAVITGYSVDEIMGSSFLPLVSTDDLPVVTQAFQNTLDGTSQHYEVTALHKTGKPIRLKVTNIPIVVDGKIIGVYGIAKDVMKEKKADALIQGQKRILEMIAKAEPLHHALTAVLELTEEQFEGSLCGISLFDVKTNSYIFATGPSLPASFIDHIKVVKVGVTGADFNEPIITANIETDATWERWKSVALANGLRACWYIPIHAVDGNILGTLVVYYRTERAPRNEELDLIKNISYLAGLAIERKQSEQHIEHLAYYDALTDLPNRRLFVERLTEVLDHAKDTKLSTAVMYLDVDRFKQINDSLGHSYGDMFLQEVAQRLKGSVRDTDFVARMSGDEFTIMLPAIATIDDAIEVAGRIIETIRQPFIFDNNEFSVTTSIGIAMYPDTADDVSTLIRNADLAMYSAKCLGKNTYQVFDDSMRGQSYEALVLQSSMSKALENNEFVLHYQPRVDSSSDKVIAAEALIRWHHPIRGMVSPGQFIPLAEETGFIVELGHWVIEEACRQNKEWQDAGYPPIRIAVNVSARQFLDNHIANSIRQILQKTGLDPQYLEVEITERTMMKHEHAILTYLSELKAMGVHVAIDDFGTGYSSLSYLKQFDIDTLKIDQSFVKGIPSNTHDVTIASTVITLAHAMNMRVVAEGVETEAQRDFLRERQCNELQGFLTGRPVPPEEFVQINFGRQIET